MGKWRMPKWPRQAWIGTAVAVLLFIIGIPGLRDDITEWGHWVSNPSWLRWLRSLPLDWLTDQGTWWIFASAGLTVLIMSNLLPLLRLVGKSDWAEKIGIATVAPPRVLEESPMTGEVSSGRSNDKDPDNDREAPAPVDRSDHVERFGVLWKVRYVPRRYVGVFASLNAMLDPPPAVRVDGPFCSNDGADLRFKDFHGDRHLMDDDDIGASGGYLFCPLCNTATRPDPNYTGKRPVSVYRKAIKEEFED